MASGKFAMAVHALAVLAQDQEGYPSEYLAGSVNTHAVFLRRVLRRLAEGGLIQAREGRGGGYRLARPAEQLTLAEVYRLVEPDGPLAPSPCEPNVRCPVGAGMRAAFEAAADKARDGVESALATQTVADVARTALRRGRTARA
ncbi:MAG: Rrf2 family transcriptional regulator, partial [Anaeromyxobacteraceae bacterium]|nr:Rrf2 family transcriptional regulator [Anaeromyxobacteraceae bacterium]